MPYDPRVLQMARMGLGMMGPFDQPPPPSRQNQPADQNKDPSQAPIAPKEPPTLLQMLMLGGVPTYSGTPRSRPGPPADRPLGWPGGPPRQERS